jgi:hypothetical protein
MAGPRSARIPDQVLSKSVDGELVLLNIENEHYYGLDEVGASMWHAVAEASTIDEAVQVLLEQFDVDPGILRSDLDHLLEELSARGLVELS